MVEGEEDVVLLVQMDWQFDLHLHTDSIARLIPYSEVSGKNFFAQKIFSFLFFNFLKRINHWVTFYSVGFIHLDLYLL